MIQLRTDGLRRRDFEVTYGEFALDLSFPPGVGRGRKQGSITDDDLKYNIKASLGDLELLLRTKRIAYAYGRATRWIVQTDSAELLLRQPSFAKKITDVSTDGKTIGTISKASIFRSEVVSNLPDGWHPVVETFVAAVAMYGWRQTTGNLMRNDAGSGAPGIGGI